MKDFQSWLLRVTIFAEVRVLKILIESNHLIKLDLKQKLINFFSTGNMLNCLGATNPGSCKPA